MPASQREIGAAFAAGVPNYFAKLRLFALLLACLCCATAFAATPAQRILQLRMDDTIQPVSEQILAHAIHTAEQQNAAALVLELNTPGGLLDSTRAMVQDIAASRVPVIVYVTPGGAHAASAGFFILESADLAAMAPGTNTGAAHPVLSDGGSGGDVMKQKMEQDAAAFLRSYAGKRGRNADAAQSAVLESKSFSADEALSQHLIEIVAPNISQLLQQSDGRKITRPDGSTLTLHTWPATVTALQPTLREITLDRLMDPDTAVFLLLVGALLIYVEFHVPGTIVPGAVGGLLLLTATFALHLLPIHLASLALLLAAGVLLLLEAKYPSHGLLSVAGIVALLVGLLTLVDGPIPQLRVHRATAITVAVAFGVLTFVLARLALRAKRQKSLTGAAALVGLPAQARTALAPDGQVFIHGEIWAARSAESVPAGEWVTVRGFNGLTLTVVPRA